MLNKPDRSKKYESKRLKMTVSFNKENEQDIKRLDFCQSVEFSKWVKDKIDLEIGLND